MIARLRGLLLCCVSVALPLVSVADTSGSEAQPGRSLYRAHECAGCHEYSGVPGLVVLPLAELALRYDVDSLADFLAAPPAEMPRFELDSDQRRALAAYLLSRFP